MAEQLAMALHLSPADRVHRGLYTNQGNMLPDTPGIMALTYSGGVASCIYEDEPKDVFQYGDIGVLLARAVRQKPGTAGSQAVSGRRDDPGDGGRRRHTHNKC